MLPKWIKLLLCLLMIVSISSCKDIASKGSNTLKRDTDGLVDFELALQSSIPIIVKIGLDNCVGCEIANEVFKTLSPKYTEVYFCKVDIIKDRQAIKDYNIKQVPTIIFFDTKGRQVYRIEDIIDEEMIIEKMKDLSFIGVN